MLLPYLELPVCIGYGNGLEEKVVIGKFQPAKIMGYHQGYYEEVGMFIYHDTQPFQIALSLEQFEAKVKAYWDMLGKKQDLKTKLGIVK